MLPVPTTRRTFLSLLGSAAGAAASLSVSGRLWAAPSAPPSPSAAPPNRAPSSTPALVWLQSLRPIALWSGPDDQAVQLGTAARWDYFQPVRPQDASRLNVVVARTGGLAWVDALSVGPSGPPPAGWPPPDSAPPPLDLSLGWLATIADSTLWSNGVGKLPLGVVPAWTPLKQMDPQEGGRIRVEDPYSGGDSYVDATSVGPVGAPEQAPLPTTWWGVIAVAGANLRATPDTKGDPLGVLPYGSPVVAASWVAGEEVETDNPTWAQLTPGAYFYSSVLRPIALPGVPPPPAEAAREAGRWIDLNLTLQVVVAYEGQAPVRVLRTSTGRPGWETATGKFSIGRREEKETMDSATLIGLDAQRADYKVENVHWAQYFTWDGMAFHENYWKARDQFGIPSSHGCPGLVAEDAKFLWEWASLGTPVYSHY